MTSADFRNVLLDASLVLKETMEACIIPVCRLYQLPPQQFHILIVLKGQGPQSVGELSGKVGILRGNITGVCKKMEQKKLIVRSRSPEDERVVLVSISEAGEKLLRDMAGDLDRCCSQFLQSESPESVEKIINGLRELCGSAQNMEEK